MAIPWEEVRKDFPALDKRVYLNTAAAGLIPPTVRPAVDNFYRELEEGGDVHWDDWLARREQVRARVATLIGAEAEEIAFVVGHVDDVRVPFVCTGREVHRAAAWTETEPLEEASLAR